MHKKAAHPRGCAARKFRREADYFLAAMAPAPPHFVQLFFSLAAVTQHGWAQALLSAAALTQQPATLEATASFLASAAWAKLKARAEPMIIASRAFFIFVVGFNWIEVSHAATSEVSRGEVFPVEKGGGLTELGWLTGS